MGDLVKLPPPRNGAPGACPLLDLFRRLNPLDQVAIVKAAEIVLQIRRQEADTDPPP